MGHRKGLCPTLFCEHTLPGRPMHLLVRLDGFFCCRQAAPPPSAPAPPLWLHSISRSGPDSSCSIGLAQGGETCGMPPGLVPTGQCFAVGSHHGTIQLAYWKRVNVCPSSLILRLAPPRNRSVCFHHAEMRFLLAWRSLISSDGGGGCPWMASRSCPLLAGSCIGGWKWGPRSCGFCLGAYGANRPLFPRGTLKWKGNYDKRPYYQSWRTEQPSLSFLE